MNAISPPSAERAEPGADSLAQQRQRCAEMADMALQLARIVFQKTLAELSEASPAQPLPTSSALLFLRLAAFAKQTTQLEARLTGSLPPPRTQAKPQSAPPPEPLPEIHPAAPDHTTHRQAQSPQTQSPQPQSPGDQEPALAPPANVGSLFDTVCQELGLQKEEAATPAAILAGGWQEQAYPYRR